MEAIDFKKLLREERKRAKQKKKEQSAERAVKVSLEKKKDETPIDQRNKSGEQVNERCRWEHPEGFLSFQQISLKCLCENPRSISYSSTALERRSLEAHPTNGNLSLPDDESKISEPRIANTIANDSNQISPETALQNWLQNLPSGDSGLGEWKVMSYGKRRVCMFGEETGGDLPPPLAEIARELVKQKVFPSSLSPNHVLLNEYQPGQGILPHTDGPRYEHRTATLSLGSDIVIEFTKRLTASEIGSKNKTTIGNESPESNHVSGKEDVDKGAGVESASAPPIQILLEAGSLLVFDDDAYLNYCHGIEMDVWRDVTTDNCLNEAPDKVIPRGLRYSLTFRHKKNETNQE